VVLPYLNTNHAEAPSRGVELKELLRTELSLSSKVLALQLKTQEQLLVKKKKKKWKKKIQMLMKTKVLTTMKGNARRLGSLRELPKAACFCHSRTPRSPRSKILESSSSSHPSALVAPPPFPLSIGNAQRRRLEKDTESPLHYYYYYYY
jgi:hypothetical protein